MKCARQVSFALAMALAAGGAALAQSSLGIGVAEQSMQPDTGLFAGFFNWVATEQRAFYQSMTETLKDMRENPAAGLTLAGLSFLYGVLHAAGPGHGKVVISSYLLARKSTLRRGIVLSFAASFVQALSALVVVGLGFLLLRQLSLSVTQTTQAFEIGSYALVAALGGWMLIRKLRTLTARRPASLGAAAVHGDHHHHAYHGHHDHHGHHAHHDHGHDHHHGHGEVCTSCGHAHMPGAHQVEQVDSLRDALAVIFSVGLRPCSGALIVLTFAFVNQLWLAGVGSVLAMALGTAITVSALASLAVGARHAAMRFAGASSRAEPVAHALEIAGALFILAVGLVLLGGALSA